MKALAVAAKLLALGIDDPQHDMVRVVLSDAGDRRSLETVLELAARRFLGNLVRRRLAWYLELGFDDCTFRHRPNRSCHKTVERIRGAVVENEPAAREFEIGPGLVLLASN